MNYPCLDARIIEDEDAVQFKYEQIRQLLCCIKIVEDFRWEFARQGNL